MDDLISRQALRSEMYHEAFEKDTEDQRWDSGCWIRYRMFERVIDRQPSAQPEIKCIAKIMLTEEQVQEAFEKAKKEILVAQSEPKWIPVSERYPEPDERVLVTDGYCYYVWDCMSNRAEGYFWEDESGYYHNKYDVVAWMPLPEPYREVKE